jgi:hypothetical protein
VIRYLVVAHSSNNESLGDFSVEGWLQHTPLHMKYTRGSRTSIFCSDQGQFIREKPWYHLQIIVYGVPVQPCTWKHQHQYHLVAQSWKSNIMCAEQKETGWTLDENRVIYHLSHWADSGLGFAKCRCRNPHYIRRFYAPRLFLVCPSCICTRLVISAENQ